MHAMVKFDSSEDEDEDTPAEVRKARQSVGHIRFSFNEEVHKLLGMVNGAGSSLIGRISIFVIATDSSCPVGHGH